MSGRMWPRLRLFEVGAPTTREKLNRLVTRLQKSEAPLSDNERREAAYFLRLLRDNEKAIRALESSGQGRLRDSPAPSIALDYLAQKELLGKGRVKKAVAAVAEAWTDVLGRRVAESTVEDAYTNWKTGAEYELSRLIDSKVGEYKHQWTDGRPPEYWTRSDLLEAVSLDVRDQYRSPTRRKSS